MSSATLLVSTSLFIVFVWITVQLRLAKLTLASDKRKHIVGAFAIGLGIPTASLIAASSGILANFKVVPPPIALYFAFIFSVSFYVGFSRFGDAIVKHIKPELLVLFQSFRILAELVIINGVHEGIAPPQLSFEGYNFDIITGISALIVYLYARKHPHPMLMLTFNIMGCIFLGVIAVIAFTSMPTPFRVFMSEPSNAWVTTVPYVLLPGVLVVAALITHILSFRQLAAARRASVG